MTKTPVWRHVLRAALALAGVAVLVVGFFGFLHTKAGRPLMARLGMGCPVGKVTPQQAVVSRERGMADLRGDRPAPSRSVLGLTMDASTETDVTAWATRSGVTCQGETRGFRLLRCDAVPAQALGAEGPAAESATFAFAADGKLLSVDVLRRNVSGDAAVRLYDGLTSRLARDLGPATKATEAPSAEYLAGGLMHTAVSTWRFSDYVVTITAMNLGDRGGIMLREQYGSAKRPSM